MELTQQIRVLNTDIAALKRKLKTEEVASAKVKKDMDDLALKHDDITAKRREMLTEKDQKINDLNVEILELKKTQMSLSPFVPTPSAGGKLIQVKYTHNSLMFSG